jgi:hypothetical protein
MSNVYAATTRAWFDHLAILRPERVAFWQPTPARPARIRSGERWYFKELGAPQLLGYGEFVAWEQMSVGDLFRAYGGATGYDSEEALIDAVRSFHSSFEVDSMIGNVVLSGFSSFKFERRPPQRSFRAIRLLARARSDRCIYRRRDRRRRLGDIFVA